MDRVQKLVLISAKEALAKVRITSDLAEKTGMILGYNGSQVENDFTQGLLPAWALVRDHFETLMTSENFSPKQKDSLLTRLEKEIVGNIPPINEDSLAGSLVNVAVGRVMSTFDFRGPSYVVNSGDCSSLTAIEHAIDCLQIGEADLMIAGGAYAIMNPLLWKSTEAAGLLTEDRPKPFSSLADGTVPAEGVGLFILKRLSDAIRDHDQIYSIIRGIGRASNGKETVVTETSSSTLVASIQQAHENAGTHPHQISFLEAHGSGVPFEDAAELQALTHTYSPELAVGHLKSQMGHMASAAGAASLLKSVLLLHHKKIPHGNSRILSDLKEGNRREPDFSKVFDKPRSPLLAAISTFGNGGQAYHLILEEWNPSQFPEQFELADQKAINPTAPAVSVAVTGMGAYLPGAETVEEYWNSILSKHYRIQ
jgi:acyl transferase domain-containing protein